MASEPFVKVFDMEASQVLVYHEYLAERDETVLHQIVSIDGVRSDVVLRWPGEDQEGKALAAFEKFDQARAERIVALVARVMAGDATAI